MRLSICITLKDRTKLLVEKMDELLAMDCTMQYGRTISPFKPINRQGRYLIGGSGRLERRVPPAAAGGQYAARQGGDGAEFCEGIQVRADALDAMHKDSRYQECRRLLCGHQAVEAVQEIRKELDLVRLAVPDQKADRISAGNLLDEFPG